MYTFYCLQMAFSSRSNQSTTVARRSNYREEAEHIFIAGMPVQFIPAHNALAEEAIATPAELDFEG